MSQTQIPAELRPSGPLESANTAVDIQSGLDVDRCLDDADEILGKCGLVKVSTPMAKLMHALGAKYDTIGVLKSNRGASVMNQHALMNGVVAMNNAIAAEENAERKSKLVYALGYVAEKLAKVTALMNRAEEEHRIAVEAAQPQRRNSFMPGSVVGAQTGTVINATNVQLLGHQQKAD